MLSLIEHITLANYKNYESLDCDFHPKINLVTGLNGSGKTNLLDAVYYLIFCKSAYSSTDQNNIRHGEGFMRLVGKFLRGDDKKEVVAKVATGKRKEFILNDAVYEKLANHIGLFPLVLICPDDIQLVKGHSDERRKLLDSHLAQFDRDYLLHLLQYNKCLKQRNALLKTWRLGGSFDRSLLASYDEVLVRSGQEIFEKRKNFVSDLMEDFSKSYNEISSNKEQIKMVYRSALFEDSMRDILDKNQDFDKMSQRTTMGVHRDDLVFSIHDKPLKKTGSQGQQKSFMVALKLAMFYFLKRKKSQTPILLLDDIFDKLDGERMDQLLSIVGGENFGQVFISDTHHDRLSKRLTMKKIEFKSIPISNGKIVS